MANPLANQIPYKGVGRHRVLLLHQRGCLRGAAGAVNGRRCHGIVAQDGRLEVVVRGREGERSRGGGSGVIGGILV